MTEVNAELRDLTRKLVLKPQGSFTDEDAKNAIKEIRRGATQAQIGAYAAASTLLREERTILDCFDGAWKDRVTAILDNNDVRPKGNTNKKLEIDNILRKAYRMKTFTSEEIKEFSHDVSQITDWIMMGHADHFQIGFYLTTIRINGIDKNPQIVAACAKAMTKHAISVSLDGLRRKDTPVVDIVGTGGDGHDTFNVSTTAAIVAAGAGCIVAKHGNRSSSSACGSADILEMYGCKLNKVRADNVKTSLDNPGFCFLFAQEFHPAMKNASVPRKQIGIPTIFNLMGPLINPAAPKHTLIGVSSHEVGVVVSGALKEMGVEYGMVVCGANGLDEISPEGSSHIWVVKKGEDKVVELDITPKDFGLEEHPLEDVKGGNPQQNKAMLVDLFDSDKYRDRLHELYRSKGLAAKAAYERKHRAIKDFVLLNTAALIVVADGKAPTGANLKAAVTRARKSIEHKWALKVADDFEGSTSGTELIGFSLAVLAAAALRMAVVAFK